MNKQIRRLAIGALVGMTLLNSCKKDPLKNLDNDESRIYITNYDTAAIFSSYATFGISDSVGVIQDNQFLGREKDVFDSTVINAVTSLMQQRGYQLAGTDNKPDLAINVSRVYNTSTGVFSYGNYWDYYGGYYDPFYWGYPGYGYYDPFAVGVYSITSGGLEIDLLDLKNATANGNKIKAIWTGLARGEQVFNKANAASQVTSLFQQSAYLKK